MSRVSKGSVTVGEAVPKSFGDGPQRCIRRKVNHDRSQNLLPRAGDTAHTGANRLVYNGLTTNIKRFIKYKGSPQP